jgi:hypothetical protein
LGELLADKLLADELSAGKLPFTYYFYGDKPLIFSANDVYNQRILNEVNFKTASQKISYVLTYIRWDSNPERLVFRRMR